MTMSESDVLLTVAEVAVAFAGFASLLGILGRGTSADDPRVLGVRMRAMLLTSLIVVAFSIVPIILLWYGATAGVVWAVSSAALLVATVSYLVWLLGALRRLGEAGLAASRFQRRIIMPTLLLTLSSATALLLTNAFLALPAVYMTALALLLFQSGFAFSLIVFSLLPSVD